MPSTTTLGASVVADEASLTKSGSAIGFKQTLTAKGDLLTHDGTNYAKTAVSANLGKVLKANPSAANGIGWSGAYTQVAAFTPGAAWSSKTLFNDATVPTNFSSLRVVFDLTLTGAADTLYMRFNNISTNTYQNRYFTTTTTLALANATGVSLGTSPAANSNAIFGSYDINTVRRASGAAAQIIAAVGGSYDQQTATGNALSAGIDLAADLTRIDFVLPGGVATANGTVKVLGFPT